MSSSSNTGGSKTEKDKQKMIQDKCQLILTQMLRDEDNKYCVDCDAKGLTYSFFGDLLTWILIFV